ncbi:hypothetical protein GCM10009665_56820 [Kitasatospora nipponensis]|uniref:Tight adherence protein B n=1 Tax=Kitasatospora nipponensis TaxID=258049 RepID=A0ABP4HDK2_9ACTN
MTGRHLDLAATLSLCAAGASAWARLNRRARARRRSVTVLGAPDGPGVLVRIGLRRLRRLVGAPGERRRWWGPEALLLPGGLLAGSLAHSVLPFVAAALLIVPGRRWRMRRTLAREAGDRAVAVIELCAALAGELRSGATPGQALEAVTGRQRHLGSQVARLGPQALARLVATRYGADVPSVFRWVAALPGGAGASAIAACWQVTADSGTGLAVSLDQVAAALRADLGLREEIRSELAGPRTTAALLAALPVFGLVLGSALGAQPLRILLSTPLGMGCLLAGGLLEVAGLLWTARIIRAAQADLGVHGGAVAAAGRPVGVRVRATEPRRPVRAGGPRRGRRSDLDMMEVS